MNNIIIESLEYNGEKYMYKCDKFKKGVNIILGENQHGKTTFTYLIMYILGFNVEAFKDNNDKKIKQITQDENNYICMKLRIDNYSYMLKRKIGGNTISVLEDEDVTIFPINRNNSLFDKDNKTFSDWILETLGIDLIKIENIFSTEHYLNFEDLFRYNYYDQETPKNQMISDFGVGKNIVRKTSQIKKFIFETLLSYSNNEYYSSQKRVKKYDSEIRTRKSELAFKRKLFIEISKSINLNTNLYKISDIDQKILNLQEEKKFLINHPAEIKSKKEFLDSLKIILEDIQDFIEDYKKQQKEINIEIGNAKRLYKMERKEIKTLETLATLPIIYESSKETCPICRKEVIHEKSKCVCGNHCDIDLFHFTYSNADYSDILKSKVSVNRTTLSVIDSLDSELDNIKATLSIYEQREEEILQEVKQITAELTKPDVEKSIISINKQIVLLEDAKIRNNIFEKENSLIVTAEVEICSLEEDLKKEREKLKSLEFKKYDDLQIHIDTFQSMLNEYLKRYYLLFEQDYSNEMILNKDYLPTSGIHNPHSRVTEIKIFFYLTLLKYSIINNDITYPKLLIIDTIKDHGIDNKRVEKILDIIFEFDKLDCQIIMTCGYEEFEVFGDNYNELIIEKIDKSKLLNKKVTNTL